MIAKPIAEKLNPSMTNDNLKNDEGPNSEQEKN